jgi:hypothetical protein
VAERLVGVGHLVRVFPLLDGGAALFTASTSSPARRSSIVFSLRARAALISQRMASASRRSGRTSTGTW